MSREIDNLRKEFLKELEEQAYTPGAFMHGTIWRVLEWRRKPEKAEECAKAGEQMVLFG